MPQIFRRSSNAVARASIGGAILLVVTIIAVAYTIDRGPWINRVGVPRDQPVPFSHKHHVGDEGFDCRYCHTSVENSAYAGVPATEVCMSCHTQIWPDAAPLEPVRRSWQTGQSIHWVRVHDLPDYVYFNHGIHINKGVGCSTCHGRVDEMPLTWNVNTLNMNWCINCHRNPEDYLRPRNQVFNIAYQPPPDQKALGKRLLSEYHIAPARALTDCVTCHR